MTANDHLFQIFQKEKLATEEKMRILVGVNRKLAKQKEILEQNISSLLKTARYTSLIFISDFCKETAVKKQSVVTLQYMLKCFHSLIS